MESLLFHFLNDWLYKFSAELFFVPRVSLAIKTDSHLINNKWWFNDIVPSGLMILCQVYL